MSSFLRTIRTTTLMLLSSSLLIACGADVESELPSTVETVTGAVTETVPEQQNSTTPVAGNPSQEEASTGQTPPSATATKSLQLAWAAPAKRSNGDDITINEIAGYEIQYRKVGEPLFTSSIINNPNTLEHTLEDLEQGDYEIKMAAFDTNQQYGQFSDIAIVTL